MGNQHTSDDFNSSDWTKIEGGSSNIRLWQNNHNPCIHIEQYLVSTKNEEQLNLQKQFYFQRKNHPYWIAAYYFQQQNFSTVCMRGNAAHIYIQKIPITICDLRQLTLSDLIHTYNQCLQGFKALAQILGYFQVHEKYIGINERGIVKVWAGSQWSKVGVILNQISEEKMVESILYCLRRLSISQTHKLSSLNDLLHRNNPKLTFNLALQELRNFASTFNNGIIPNRIQILQNTLNLQTFFDPLIKSKHHLLRQSKLIPISQASNSSLYKYPKKDQNNISRIKQIKEQSKSLKKLNNMRNLKSSLNLFNCFSVQQQKKASRLFTKEEMIRHYAELYQIDDFKEKSKNNKLFQQNTSLLTYNMKNEAKHNIQDQTCIKRPDLKRLQNYYFADQYNNNKPYSFHHLLRQQQQPHSHNPQNYDVKPQNLLRESDIYASRARGKYLRTNNQKQSIRFIPQFNIKYINNQNPQMSSQVSINFESQKNYTLANQTCTTQSRANIHYYNHSTIRKPLNVIQPNINGNFKFDYRNEAQRNNI